MAERQQLGYLGMVLRSGCFEYFLPFVFSEPYHELQRGKGYKSTNQFFVKCSPQRACVAVTLWSICRRPDSQIYESRHQALKDAEEGSCRVVVQ